MQHEPPDPPGPSEVRARVWKAEGGEVRAAEDALAVEEPLEIRLSAGGQEKTVAVTMRTPGADKELALGFLYGEGVIHACDEVRRVTVLADPWARAGQPSNVLAVELTATELPELAALERHFFASSACGVCGKAGIANLRLRMPRLEASGPTISAAVLSSLPERLRAAQSVFAATGGLHAAALFTPEGELLAVREDVGRHNATDKLVGWALGEGRLPLASGVVLVSGRSSFEIVQKCVAAGVPIVASVSAPSSLAVALAEEVGATLVGFLRDERFNVYSGRERIRN